MAPLRDGGGREGQKHHRCRLYSPAQESQWLDSVSLLIKDSFEGDMIDNLSGSVFHHYCPPPVCKDCKDHPQEIQLAEVEQASLRSEQMSDKSSSPALPDDLSLDEHSCYQMLVRYSQRGSSDSHSSEELPTQGCYRGILPSSSGSEEGVQELYEVGVHPQVNSPSLEQQSPAPCTGGDGGSRGEGGSSPVFHLPADFFHPAAVAHPGRPRTRVGPGDRGPSRPRTRVGPGDRGPSRPPSPASWASLRSAGADSRPLSSQHPSHSDSSLATGSSEGSLQTTLEEGLSFSVSPPLPMALPIHPQEEPASQDPPLLKRRSTTFTLQTTRGHQRSQSSGGGGSTSPGCPRQDSMDPSDEEVGMGTGVCRQTLNSEHLSETLNSLSLTSLLSPGSLAPPLVKKCNSTGSLDQTNVSARSKDGRHLIDAHGYLSNPWTEGRAAGQRQEEDITDFSGKPTDTSSRKNR